MTGRQSEPQLTTPDHILADVESVKGDLLTRARQRTVVSRSYYAAFHAARLAADEKGIDTAFDKTKRGGMHSQFIEVLIRSDNSLISNAGRRLKKIYDRRLTADYKLTDIMTADIAIAALEDAQDVVDMLRPVPGS